MNMMAFHGTSDARRIESYNVRCDGLNSTCRAILALEKRWMEARPKLRRLELLTELAARYPRGAPAESDGRQT